MVRVGGFDRPNWPEDPVLGSWDSWAITYNVLRGELWEWAAQIQSASRSVAKYAPLAKLPDLLSPSAEVLLLLYPLSGDRRASIWYLLDACSSPLSQYIKASVCWPGLHNASSLLHSMALNDAVKLVCHTHRTNIILMDPLCCYGLFPFSITTLWNENEDSFLLCYKLDITYAQVRWFIYPFHKHHVQTTVKYLSYNIYIYCWETLLIKKFLEIETILRNRKRCDNFYTLFFVYAVPFESLGSVRFF